MIEPDAVRRFLEAQDPVYQRVRAELAAGAKSSHWMWFVFPQLQGLGRSAMAVRFGIASVDEAKAYWHHPILGARLRDCVELVLAVKGKTAYQILGSPDDMKFRSCLTLFGLVIPDELLFRRALTKYFDGEDDPRTTKLLAGR